VTVCPCYGVADFVLVLGDAGIAAADLVGDLPSDLDSLRGALGGERHGSILGQSQLRIAGVLDSRSGDRSPPSEGGHVVRRLVLAGLLGLSLLVVAAPGVSADCVAGDSSCVQLDVTSGPPGTLVTMNAPALFETCRGDVAEVVAFYHGDASGPISAWPTSPITDTGAEASGTFRVPQVAPGLWEVTFGCPDADVWGTGAQFTVTPAPPDTATDEVVDPTADGRPALLLVAIGAAVFVVGLRRPTRRPVRARR